MHPGFSNPPQVFEGGNLIPLEDCGALKTVEQAALFGRRPMLTVWLRVAQSAGVTSAHDIQRRGGIDVMGGGINVYPLGYFLRPAYVVDLSDMRHVGVRRQA